MPILVVNQSLLDSLVAEAKASPRLRKNFNFHKDLNEETWGQVPVSECLRDKI